MLLYFIKISSINIRSVFYEKTLSMILAFIILGILLFSSCASKMGAAEEAKIKEAFDGAYTAATYFSTHAKNVYTDGALKSNMTVITIRRFGMTALLLVRLWQSFMKC